MLYERMLSDSEINTLSGSLTKSIVRVRAG
jgi:hypothetical protein